jgi:hypothetical protein
MRLNTKGMDARRGAQRMVIPFASFATPQTPFCVQTLRAGHALRAWRCPTGTSFGRYSPLVWNNQTARLSPSPARNAWPAHIRSLLK